MDRRDRGPEIPSPRTREVSIEIEGVGTRQLTVPFWAYPADDVAIQIDYVDGRFAAVSLVVSGAPDDEGIDVYLGNELAAKNALPLTALSPDVVTEAFRAIDPKTVGDRVLWEVMSSDMYRVAIPGQGLAESGKALASVADSIRMSDRRALSARTLAGDKHSRVTLQDLKKVAEAVRTRNHGRPYAAVMQMPDRRVGRARAYQLIDQAVEAGLLTKEDLK